MKNYSITKSLLLAEVELSYKPKIKPADRMKAITSKQAADILRSVWNEDRIEYIEDFVILLLNPSSDVLGWARVSMGGIKQTICDPKVVFQIALSANATQVILCHNHPSGNTNPSDMDRRLTSRLVTAGNLLDLKIVDHIILTGEQYFSFADDGLLYGE